MLHHMKRKLYQLQGTVARLTNHLPTSVQTKLAKRLGYQYDYAGLNPHVQLLLAVRGLNQHGLIDGTPEESRRRFRHDMAAIVA